MDLNEPKSMPSPALLEWRRTLPPNVQACRTAALCQDPCAWQALQDENFAHRAMAALGADLPAWNPAELALLALEYPVSASQLRLDPALAVETKALPGALKAFEAFALQPAAAEAALTRLQKAGQVALILRERRRKTGSWQGLVNEILKGRPASLLEWQTPLACTLGMVSDPADFLAALLEQPNQVFPHSPEAAVHLLLQVLLSNPFNPQEQAAFLQNLLKQGKVHAGLLLEALAVQRPEQARSLAQWMLQQDFFSTLPNSAAGAARANLTYPYETLLASTQSLSWQALLQQHSGNQSESFELLSQARRQLAWLQSELAALWAAQAETVPAEEVTGDQIVKAWQEAVVSTLPGSLADPLSSAHYERNPRYESNLQLAEFRSAPNLYLAQAGPAFVSTGTECEETALPALPADPSFLVELARYYLDNQDVLKAIESAHQALVNATPLDAASQNASRQLHTLLSLGGLFLELGLPASAVSAVQIALAICPVNLEAHQVLGQSLARQHRPAAAVAPLLTAALLAPERLDVQRFLAAAWEEAGHWDAALDERLAIARLSGQKDVVSQSADLHALADCALKANAFQEAAAACEQALELDPQDWQAHHLDGQVFQKMGDHEQALVHFSKAVELAPQEAACWLDLAALHSLNNAHDKASETLLGALQALPDSPAIHLRYGELLLGQDAQTQAMEAFQNAYDLAHSQADTPAEISEQAGLRLGVSLQNLGHLTEARAIIEPIYFTTPALPATARIYARLLVALQDFSAALPALQAACQPGPVEALSDGGLLFDYGLALVTLKNDPCLAAACLKCCLELDPENLEARALLAEAYTIAQDFPAALEMYRSAIDSELGSSPRWQLRLSKGLGITALALQRAEIALAAFQEVVSLDPACAECQRYLAEANWLAGLGNDAMEAARTSLNLDSSLEAVLWFADKVLAWSGGLPDAAQSGLARPKGKTLKTFYLSPAEMLAEAVPVLEHASGQYPGSADILLRLGRIQVCMVLLPEALETLSRIAALEPANPDMLEQAAAELMEICAKAAQPAQANLTHLAASQAADCLETAFALSSTTPASEQAVRLVHLAEARQQSRQAPEMLQALERALALDSSQPRIYQLMVQAYVAQGELDRALEVLRQADVQVTEPCMLVELHLQASNVAQTAGRLADALFHAEQALHRCLSMAGSHLDAACKLQLAGLFWELLLPDLALRALQSISRPEDLDNQEAFDYFCLQSELALASNLEVEAAFYLTQAFNCSPDHPWALALQARLLFKQKDQPLAVNALQSLVEKQSSVASSHLAAAIARSAAEMAEWDVAIDLMHPAADPETLQPAAAAAPCLPLYLAELMVRRAEFSALCRDLDVQRHTPGEAAFSAESQALFVRAIQAADTALLQVIQDAGKLDASQALTPGSCLHQAENTWKSALIQIARWKCRGAAIFIRPPAGKSAAAASRLSVPAGWAAWYGFPLQSEDSAARLAAARSEQSAQQRQAPQSLARQAVEAYPQDGLVLLQAALAFAPAAPGEALHCAQSAKNLLSALPRHPLNILAHRLLAQLEKQSGSLTAALHAIHIALAAWPDEARWHNLAARIRMGLPFSAGPEAGSEDDLSASPDAVAYLEEAIRLEPDCADHAILLSQVIQTNAHGDPQAHRKALRILEQGSKDNPQNAELWLALANLYRFTAAKAAAAGKPERKLALSSASSAAACAERAASLAEEQNEPEIGANAHVLLGRLALAKNDVEEAYRQARLALKIQTNHSAGTLLQVECLEALGRPEDAIELLDKSLSLKPNNLNIEIKRAALMSAQSAQAPGNSQPAPTALVGLDLLENLAMQHPDEPKVFSALAKNLAAVNRKEEAIQNAQRALALANQPELPGETTTDLTGERPAAESLTVKEISDLHQLLGAMYAGLGHLDQAVHQFDSALQYNPENVDAYLALADVYFKQRLFLKTEAVLKEAINAAPNEALVYYQAGVMYKQGHNYKEAELMLHKAASLAPDDIKIKRQLASMMAANLMVSQQNYPRPVESLDGVS